MTDETVLDFPIDVDRLTRAMDTSDDIGSVLRIHLELERALTHVVAAILPLPEKAKLNYPSQKINFLLAAGIPEFRLKPAAIINSIRNGMAHRESKDVIEENDLPSLFQAINVVIANRLTEEFELVRHRNGAQTSKKYKDMSPREKFCFLGSMAIAVTASLSNELKSASAKPPSA
ncbi:hypothetical protein NML43_25405 [Rhodopseudomonas palustris]|uniref:hypothetical protein n=1 Tax=Rhodopseudomonas palustris TaxID=1076 RepID=UPI0020CBBAC5|nr:hypothetical protein [Rhodopseudomonas palustris]MCP9630443.1 hypothetical protein [Rhodopseudomonas palustris]